MGKVPGLSDAEYKRFRVLARRTTQNKHELDDLRNLTKKLKDANGGTVFNYYGPPWTPTAEERFQRDFHRPWWKRWLGIS